MHHLRRACLVFVVVYWAFLLTMTHLPPKHLPDIGVNDKFEHVGAYGLLAGALFVTIWLWRPGVNHLWLVVLAVGMAYGAFDERTQPMFGRSCDFGDWMADTIGTAIAAGILTLLKPWVERRWALGGARADRSTAASASAPL